jgi:hypothetical protein
MGPLDNEVSPLNFDEAHFSFRCSRLESKLNYRFTH